MVCADNVARALSIQTRLRSQTRDAPPRLNDMQSRGGPEKNPRRSLTEPGIGQDCADWEIVGQHRHDDAGRCDAAFVMPRAPTGNSQSNQRCSGHASDGRGGLRIERPANKKRCRQCRRNEQRYAGGRLYRSSDRE